MGLAFDKSWPERARKVSNQTLGEYLQKQWGADAERRHGDVLAALQLLEETGDLTRDEAALILHSGQLESSQFLQDIDAVVQNNIRYDEDSMAMNGLKDGIRSVVNNTRLDWYKANDFDSTTSRADLEAELSRQATERERELTKDPAFNLHVEEPSPLEDINRDELGRPQLQFKDMDGETDNGDNDE